MQAIGERIRRLRERAGLTQGQLAKRAATSQGYLSQLEGGISDNPSIGTATRMAKALGVELEELLGVKEVSSTLTYPPLMDQINKLTFSQQKALSVFLRDL